MSLLLDDAALDARRSVATGALRLLADGLLDELAPLLDERVSIPTEKALLTRTGGRCPHDGTMLRFDPLDPRLVCPVCGTKLQGGLHDRFRPYWMQLWLAERVLHAAVLGVLLDDAQCVRAAWRVLDEYAHGYLGYPNRDNVLGPSRPFFSTYLESIWLLQLVLALDLLESRGDDAARARGGRIRDRVVEPSIELIASYDEGLSNRQVWNNAALVAAGTLLARPELVDRALEGPSGLRTHLAEALLGDGSWYEGENYHLFAHRGLWYAMTVAEGLGRAPEDALRRRFDDGFVAPFRTLLPDLTYPSRRDSQYAVSVRQPRFAESCELGLARRDDPRLVGMLARLYDPLIERRDTGRRASTADVESNRAATGLVRADLSWRALLFAREQLPPLVVHPLESDLLPAQGFGILRRDGGALFVGLDYGHSGGGHGHPDRLNLLLSDGDVRWFDDPGTGAYVEESLHWYRSTLAHCAPLLDGRSQPRVHGTLLAFEEQGVAGWISARAPLAGDCDVRRSIVVLHDYLVDRIEWTSDSEHEVSLPLHGVAVLATGGELLVADPSPIEGGVEREDGFRYLTETGCLPVVDDVVRLRGARGGTGTQQLDGWIATTPPASWWSARTLGAPGRPEQSLVLPRVKARTGAITAVWSWHGAIATVIADGEALRITRSDGAVDVHAPRGDGWEIFTGRGSSIILRGGTPAAGEAAPPRAPAASRGATPIPIPAQLELGEEHYRRSEESWTEAGSPTATISIERGNEALHVSVTVPMSARRFVAIDAENLFDNDPAAIHGDGVQLYVEAADRSGGWLLVPDAATNDVGMRVAEGWSDEIRPRATWRATSDGYQLDAELPLSLGAEPLALDVLVNVSGPDRARRCGQLVLSGAHGEFVYLRSDRHDAERLLPLRTVA
ncbi:MAG TPA: heparinase II/III family protein [Gemmatimonadaceae bacterium]